MSGYQQRHPSSSADNTLVDRIQALRRHAQAATAQRRHDEAVSLLTQACALAPANAALACELGRSHGRRGEMEASLVCFQRAVSSDPDSIEARFFLGFTLLRMDRSMEALSHLRLVYRMHPEEQHVLVALVDAELHVGNDSEALAVLDQALLKGLDDENLLLKRGEILTRLGRHAQAITHFRDAARRLPNHPGLWMALAQGLDEAGMREDAESAYRQALQLRPAWPQPLAGLLGMCRGESKPDDIAMAVDLLARNLLDDADTALLAYPLGRVFDALGRPVEAFDMWRRANAAREREVGTLDVQALEENLTRQLVEPRPSARSRVAGSGSQLTFVVGMPRSGTTLIEQILDAHPRISGCGELPFFADLVIRCPNPSTLDERQIESEAKTYLSSAYRVAAANAQRLVDKAPLNAFHLDHVAHLFPDARVIWCRRDARDVALSIFSENFTKAATFATSLESIAACINAQHRLMRHWQKVLGLPIFEVEYESLVEDFEPGVRRLLAFCGVEWSSACLDFHHRRRVVRTPSRWQVRQPVHRGSIGRWRNYAAQLAPLLRTLDLVNDHDGIPRT